MGEEAQGKQGNYSHLDQTSRCFSLSVIQGNGFDELTFPLDNNGEGNGTPLQYSCLENPKDGGAW